MPKTVSLKKETIPSEFRFRPNRLIRVPRAQRHTLKAGEPSKTRVRITMYVDLDVLDYFRGLASEPGAAPYQRQMQMALRRAMQRGQGKEGDNEYSRLLADDDFIGAIAKRVKGLKN